MLEIHDRATRVRLLLESLNDWVPAPLSAMRSDSGPAASRYVPCETCRRSGVVRGRSVFVLCLVCDGAGWRRRVPGDVEWDAYVEMPVAEAVDLPTMSAPRRLEADGEEEAYGWEHARRSHDRHGSYKEVRLRLEHLGHRRPRRYRLIRAVLVDKEPRRLTEADDVEIALGVAEIALRMRTVRVPPWIMERSAASEKRETVFALAADGYGAGEIARKTGLTKEAVRRKLRRIAIRSGHAGIPRGAM